MSIRPLIALAMVLLPLHAARAQHPQPEPQITVTGSAELKVPPDEVFIVAGVETRDADLKTATQRNNKQIADALATLKKLGVPEKDIQTDFIQVIPDYGPGDHQREPRFYIARKSISVRLSNVTNLEPVLTGLLNTGANHILDVQFRTTRLREYRDKARAMAVRAAAEKADALLMELDRKRGRPLRIDAHEHGGWWNWSGVGGQWGHAGFARMSAQNVMAGAAEIADPSGPSVAPGQITVSASVNASFLIE
jgi:uncharacterized protein